MVDACHDARLSDSLKLSTCCPQLRFNKVSELIHNSTNHRNLEQARVIVYFQEIIDKVHLATACTPCT